MKANELMIGDWVLTLDPTHKKQVYAQIWAIEEGQTSILVKKDITDWFVDIEWLEPIPLTSEILEKNGIKLEGVGDNGISTPPKWRNRFEKWVLRTQWRDTFIWYDRTAKYWHLHDMGAAKLLYVHELQHALRLCGIEKEIELC